MSTSVGFYKVTNEELKRKHTLLINAFFFIYKLYILHGNTSKLCTCKKYSKNKRKDGTIDNSFKNIHVGSQYISLFYTSSFSHGYKNSPSINNSLKVILMIFHKHFPHTISTNKFAMLLLLWLLTQLRISKCVQKCLS